jgi:glycosyltransferase involved in cell wall biosynthesis
MEIADASRDAVSERMIEKRVSASIMVVAFNEEQDLRPTIVSTMRAVSEVDNLDVEIVIVNDGSSDRTREIAESLAAEYPLVRCVHHDTNRGFGEAFRSGLAAARNEYVTFIPGDNLVSVSMLRETLRHLGQADIICSFPVNVENRSRLRRVVSSLFSFLYRQTFDLPLRAIHTTSAYPVRLLQNTPLRSRRYSLASEIMVKLLRQGCTFLELPGYLNSSQNKSSALQMKNLIEVIGNYLWLINEVYVAKRSVYSRTPVRVIPKDLR